MILEPDQSLKAGHFAGAELHDGLVDQVETSRADCRTQNVFHFNTFAEHCLHAFFKDNVAVFSRVFGMMKGNVGLDQDLLDCGAVKGEAYHTHAAGDAAPLPFPQGRLQPAVDSVYIHRNSFQFKAVPNDDHKLIAAKAVGSGIGGDLFLQKLSGCSQNAVAKMVPLRIIDVLKIVDIKQKHCSWSSAV